MKKYIGIITFVSLQVITLFSFTQLLGLSSLLGIWAVIYLYIFSSIIFNTTLHFGGRHYTGLRGNNNIVKEDYNNVKGDMTAREVYLNNKEPRFSSKYFNTKWIYLGLFITNAVSCFIIIKG